MSIFLILIGFSTNKTWLPVNPNYKTLNLKNEMKSSKSHYSMYKRLVEARKRPVIQKGSLNISILSEDIFSFSRQATYHIFCSSLSLCQSTSTKIPQTVSVLVLFKIPNYLFICMVEGGWVSPSQNPQTGVRHL